MVSERSETRRAADETPPHQPRKQSPPRAASAPPAPGASLPGPFSGAEPRLQLGEAERRKGPQVITWLLPRTSSCGPITRLCPPHKDISPLNSAQNQPRTHDVGSELPHQHCGPLLFPQETAHTNQAPWLKHPYEHPGTGLGPAARISWRFCCGIRALRPHRDTGSVRASSQAAGGTG